MDIGGENLEPIRGQIGDVGMRENPAERSATPEEEALLEQGEKEIRTFLSENLGPDMKYFTVQAGGSLVSKLRQGFEVIVFYKNNPKVTPAEKRAPAEVVSKVRTILQQAGYELLQGGRAPAIRVKLKDKLINRGVDS